MFVDYLVERHNVMRAHNVYEYVGIEPDEPFWTEWTVQKNQVLFPDVDKSN